MTWYIRESKPAKSYGLRKWIPPVSLLRKDVASNGPAWLPLVLVLGAISAVAYAPWQRAYVERVIGSIRRECLDHVIVFHERPPKNAPIIFRVLSSIENPSFVGKGRTGAPSDSAAGNGVGCGGAAGRWVAPPLRATGCLKNQIHHANALSLLRPFASLFARLHRRISFTRLRQGCKLVESWTRLLV
jgi:hypothetical protein